MSVVSLRRTDASVRKCLDFMDELFKRVRSDFCVRLWEGTEWVSSSGRPPRFTLVLKHPGALRRMLLPPNQLTLGEAYIHDDFDVEGDIEEAFVLGDVLLDLRLTPADKLRYGAFLLSLPDRERSVGGRGPARLRGRIHSPERDSEAVTYHYNVSNDFYRLWLDENMVYSCAYFQFPGEPLETAQEHKLDYLCRKLRLRPGERLLDIGCGWGGLILHAVRHYDVEALGITLSEPQAELANERIRKAGLSDRCRAEVLDYREVPEDRTFDKLVSVGMFEHVGESRLPDYFAKAFRLLRPGGLFLNHGIADTLAVPQLKGPSFIEKYVFPDGELLPLAATLMTAERCGFEARDVESLREHYAMTLRHWIRRLEKEKDKAIRLTNDLTYRVWRLYMGGSAHGFKVGRLNLYQTLLARPNKGRCELPLTRGDLYTEPESPKITNI